VAQPLLAAEENDFDALRPNFRGWHQSSAGTMQLEGSTKDTKKHEKLYRAGFFQLTKQ
jgi:hypothetical protein